MFKAWMRRMKSGAKKTRFEQYEQKLELIRPHLFDGKKIPGMLSNLWRDIDIRDLLIFDPQDRISLSFSLKHTTLKELVEYLETVNQLICEEEEGLLRQLSQQNFKKARAVDVDLYFADERGRAVDVTSLLIKLKGQLLHHITILDTVGHGYYNRLAEVLYTEIYDMTDQLIRLAKQKEYS